MDLSIVVPVYNSEETLESLFLGLKKTIESLELSFEVIFVEDGGKDNSWGVLCELKQAYPKEITAIRLSKNFGQHNATLCGFSFAKGRMVITIDDDLQTPPNEIKKLVETYQRTEADLVYGIYPQKEHSWFRNLGSNTLSWIFRRFVTGIRTGSSFRLIRGELVRQIQGKQHHFLYIDHILSWYTHDIQFVEVDHRKREIGQSNYSTWKLISMAINLIIHYTDIPLRMMTYGGLFASIVSFLIGVGYIYKKLMYDVALGFTSIIVSIFFSTGIILMCLGILGEYISRIYANRSEKPLFFIKEKR